MPCFEFIEAPGFTRRLPDYLDDDEYAELQRWLCDHAEAGAVIPGSGGVRKLRWGLQGRGKRGGLRIIYYMLSASGQIWMLTLYSKNMRENLPNHVIKALREELESA